jgi:hypothetical protein
LASTIVCFCHGFVERVFDESVSSEDIDISYNRRNFIYKKDSFRSNFRPKILIIGNSFGRDFVNVIRETYDFSKLELVYRDDYDICSLFETDSGQVLYTESDIIVYASNYDTATNTLCIDNALRFASEVGASLFFVGTKQFGFNNNWIARTELNERKLLRNPALARYN